ncbi:MAG: hypothetical protein NVS1B11_30600 [Terriglobales bacterium]
MLAYFQAVIVYVSLRGLAQQFGEKNVLWHTSPGFIRNYRLAEFPPLRCHPTDSIVETVVYA